MVVTHSLTLCCARVCMQASDFESFSEDDDDDDDDSDSSGCEWETEDEELIAADSNTRSVVGGLLGANLPVVCYQRPQSSHAVSWRLRKRNCYLWTPVQGQLSEDCGC